MIINNECKQEDLIKTNYKCIENKLNQCRIRPIDNTGFYNIMSSYDGKCLNYSDDKISMVYCRNDNKNQASSIKYGKICSGTNKCLDGNYKINPVILQSVKYDHLTCSSIYVKRGYNCCLNQNTPVEYINKIGNWSIEDGKFCGIGYQRRTFSILDGSYQCCSSVNPEVAYIDEKRK